MKKTQKTSPRPRSVHSAEIPFPPISGTTEISAKTPVYYFGNSLNNAIFAGVWNDKAYRELCLILKYIENETVCYERLREERFGGKTENDKIRRSVICLLGGSRSTSTAFRASGKGVPSSTVGGDAGIVRAFAEYRYCWHNKAIAYIRQFGAKFHAKGKEARVYLSKDESFVYKIKNDVSNDLLKFFDEIINHNILFPSTEYIILGFGLDEHGRFCTILKQDAVKGRPATLKEIEKHFLERGFKKLSDFAYKKGDYIVSDLKPSNVVYSKGKCFVIDCFAQTIFDFDNNFYISTPRPVNSAEISFPHLSGIKSAAKTIAKNVKNAFKNLSLPEITNNSGYEIDDIPETLADRKAMLERMLVPLIGTKKYCTGLRDFAEITGGSVPEICYHASKNKASTLAALCLLDVIAAAKYIPPPTSPHGSTQAKRHISEMYELRCKIKGLGVVKLTIGKRTYNSDMVYCITKFRFDKITKK